MKALVIHAARLKERGEHIDRMLRGIGMDYEFIREGDADALTDDLLDRFLADGP
jgi:glycosyl transferase family 25